MLNRWKFFQQRARFDIARGRASRDRNGHMTIQTPQRQIYVRCNFCDGVRINQIPAPLSTRKSLQYHFSPSSFQTLCGPLIHLANINRVSHTTQLFPTHAPKMANTSHHNCHLNPSPPAAPITTITATTAAAVILGNLLSALNASNLYPVVPSVSYISVRQITKEQKLASKCCHWMKSQE